MKKKASISKEKRDSLRIELKSNKISLESVATEADVSQRSVMYFFSGRHYNPTIHQAAIRLLQERANIDLDKATEKAKAITQLI